MDLWFDQLKLDLIEELTDYLCAVGAQFSIAQWMESMPPQGAQLPVACCASVVVRRGAVV
jgi:hypothetical protein